MASRGAIVVDRPDVVIVRVAHGIADSFSRSVLPTSVRHWRKARHYGHSTRFRAYDLAPDWTVEGTRCASFVAYGPSHPAAQAALTAYVLAHAPAHARAGGDTAPASP